MRHQIRFVLFLALPLLLWALPTRASTTTVNGLTITFDDFSGQILKMQHATTGVIMETTPAYTGLKHQWTVTGAPDGRSVIMKATVTNAMTFTFGDFPFPDLQGVKAFGQTTTSQRMELRMALGAINPFAGAPFSRMYAGDIYQMYALRWMDIGSLKSGLSVYQRTWLEEERQAIGVSAPPKQRASLWVSRSAADPNSLQIAWWHHVQIPPGGSWQSDEYWFTPHEGGWAKGIEPYRAYVQQVQPARIIPTRVRDGLGLMSAWMVEGLEPSSHPRVNFSYRDLPAMAVDAKAHGLEEMVLIGSVLYGQLPIPHEARAGTKAEFVAGAAGAKAAGVNVAPFINVYDVGCSAPAAPASFSLAAASTWQFQFSTWLYHSELIPGIESPPYIHVDTLTQPVHQEFANHYPCLTQVSTALQEWAQQGVTSFMFDVFQDDGSLNLADGVRNIRNTVLTPIDSQSTISGEPYLINFERAARVLDYTWGWTDYVEAGPYVSTVRYPRIAINVASSPRVAKMAFADGLYINAMPKQPNRANGSALVSSVPALSAALKEVSPRRQQFLSYFTQGNFIGESVLVDPVVDFIRPGKSTWIGGATIDVGDFIYPEVFVRGHVLPGRMLIIVLNNGATTRSVTFRTKPRLWLPSKSKYTVTSYDSAGRNLGSTIVTPAADGTWQKTTAQLAPLGLAYFEVIPR